MNWQGFWAERVSMRGISVCVKRQTVFFWKLWGLNLGAEGCRKLVAENVLQSKG